MSIKHIDKSKGSEQPFEYEVDYLLDNCEKIVKQKREVAEGALSKEAKSKMSKEEFKKKIEDFLKRRAK